MDILLHLWMAALIATGNRPVESPSASKVAFQYAYQKEQERIKLEQATANRHPVSSVAKASNQTPVVTSGGSGCSMDYIKQKESGGNYQAVNKQGSSASGAWQVLDSTWNRYQGYARAKDAPPAVQDQFATELYNRRGSQPWSVCK